MAISQDIIDKVRETADIVDVIADSVTIKKKGQNYLGLCPFHSEKTPSFNVNPSKNIYKCFGCGKSGDAIKFTIEYKGMTFFEAVKELAKRYSIDIPESEKGENKDTKEPLYVAMKYAAKVYSDFIFSPDGKDALYYAHSRGYSKETIEKFSIGLSFRGYNTFKDLALKNHYKAEILESCGLLKRGETSVYDTFRERLMFPVKDIQGRVIAFTGRTLNNELPKYINSPTTSIYSKSDALYGIYEAKEEIRANDSCMLLEGSTDVVALHNAGIENCVASLGTALTANQCKIIKRLTENLIVVFDGDGAGVKAALKGIDIALENGLKVTAVLLPSKSDPDELIKTKGAEYFKQLLEDRIDFIDFKVNALLSDLSDISIKADTINDIMQSICKINDSLKRSLYISKVARLMSVPERELKAIESKLAKPEKQCSDIAVLKPKISNEVAKPIKTLTYSNEFEIIRILVMYGNRKIVLKKGSEIYESNFTISEYIFENCEPEIFDNLIFQKMLYICTTEFEYGKFAGLDYFKSNEESELREIAFEIQAKSERSGLDWSSLGIELDSDFQTSCNSLFEVINRLKYRYIAAKERTAILHLLATNDETLIPEIDHLRGLRIEIYNNFK